MTHDQPESFRLPEWGTEGAPPAPAGTSDDTETSPHVDFDLLLNVEPEIVQSTTSLPALYRIRSVIGLVSAEGSSSMAGGLSFQAATATAKAAALDRLTSEAATIGADAVTGIRLSVAVRLNDVVVLAYGTAVDAELG